MSADSAISDRMDSNNDTKHRRHDDRLSTIDSRLLDVGDDLTDLGRAVSSHETAIGTIGSEVNSLINQPSKMPLVMSIVGVAITVMALALTPVAWLAIHNAEKLDLARASDANNSAAINALTGQARNNHGLLHDALKDLNDRIKHLERLEMSETP